MTGGGPAPCAILLATYQGERYLPEQLESLAGQRHGAWQLLWRDDGSTDRTVALLNDFAAARPPGAVRHVETPAERLGAMGSFMALLAAAPDDAPAAFCDQDDVWLPDKLERALAALAAVPPGRPALYCARQRIVAEDLRELGLSPALRRPPGFRNALVQNIATGCTMVLNPEARRLVLSAPPPAGSMHDWWAYLMVTGCGGTVIFDDEPVILYRQHGANAVGAADGFLTRSRQALRRGAGRFLGLLAAHMRALAGAPLTPENRRLLEDLAVLAEAGPLRRLLGLRRARLYRQGRAEDLLLWLWIGTRPLPPS